MNVCFDWPAPLPFSSCVRIRLAPQPGCFRSISTMTTSTSPLQRCGHEFGRGHRSTGPATPSGQIPAQP
jgi:hypothetical protein